MRLATFSVSLHRLAVMPNGVIMCPSCTCLLCPSGCRRWLVCWPATVMASMVADVSRSFTLDAALNRVSCSTWAPQPGVSDMPNSCRWVSYSQWTFCLLEGLGGQACLPFVGVWEGGYGGRNLLLRAAVRRLGGGLSRARAPDVLLSSVLT